MTLRVIRMEVVPVRLALAEPYEIAYSRYAHADNALVRIVTDGPHVGLGCAAPELDVTGEDLAATVAALRDVAEPALRGVDPIAHAAVRESVRAGLRHAPAARAAVDMALYDLLGKQLGIPVYRLLGGYRRSFPTSVTLGIAPLGETVASARRRVAQGFGALKIKGGQDAEVDAKVLCAVREAVGPGIELRFDANQGYTVAQAQRFVRLVRGVGIELLEQPTSVEQPRLLRQVTESVAVHVMADESLLSVRDAIGLAHGEQVDLVNVKLMKVGGIEPAITVDAIARAAGIGTMVGCMDECALGIAAGLAVALARPNIRYVDLDGHLDLLGDPTADAVRLAGGTLWPSEAPGLGLVDLDARATAKCRVYGAQPRSV
jgi:L-alanine-DL-glutamate epimerase-like enolase superfamily enzyme